MDTIGYWSEVELDLVSKYAAEYSKIMNNQGIFCYAYIDAFAGAGVNVSRQTGQFVPGSALNALVIEPPFHKYYLIDYDGSKVAILRKSVSEYPNADRVEIFEEDCNTALIQTILPKARYQDYWRALCLLDPYGLHLNWSVVEMAGRMRSVDIFLNFPIMDINRNALRRDPDNGSLARMTAFWGDESWRDSLLSIHPQPDLFDIGDSKMKASNLRVVEVYRERLRKVAGFDYVSMPLAMRNSTNAVIYYLMLASQKAVAKKIVDYIFDRYEDYGIH